MAPSHPQKPEPSTANSEFVGRWAREWHRQLQRFLAKRVPGHADAQDLAQEVYLRLLRFDGIDLIRHPQAYLCKMAAHVACEWQLESRQAKPHSGEGLEDLVTEDISGEGIDLERRRQRLCSALTQLPQPMSTALVLRYRDELSYEEIAVRMQTSLRSVRRYIEQGYARLRMQLGAKAQGKK